MKIGDLSTTIIVPCYNEEKRIDIHKFTSYINSVSDVHFLFVNDGSTDATEQMIEAFAAKHAQLHCLSLPQNMGKAEAVRQGMLYAADHFDAKYIGFWDADLATPLEELTGFITVMQKKNCDAVTGLRLKRLGANVARKASRHFLGRIFATVAANILKINVYDTQCGAKLFRAELIPELFSEKFVSRWFFDIEILARYTIVHGITKANRDIYEYPVMTWEDISGSQLKISDFLFAPIELLKIKNKYFTKDKK